MKFFICIILFLFPLVFSFAQQDPYFAEWNKEQIDSLRSIWSKTKNDTIRMAVSRSLGFYYQETNRDSSLHYHTEQLRLARLLTQPI